MIITIIVITHSLSAKCLSNDYTSVGVTLMVPGTVTLLLISAEARTQGFR